MKKPTPEDLHLWKTHIKDVIPLASEKVTAPPLPKPPLKRTDTPPDTSTTRSRNVDLSAPLPLPSLNRKALRHIEIEATLDLHGHTLETGYKILEGFLRKAQERGIKTLLIITGKGSLNREASFRYQLPRWLRETSLRQFITSLHHPAKPQDGGTGAYYVKVKRKGRSSPADRVARKSY